MCIICCVAGIFCSFAPIRFNPLALFTGLKSTRLPVVRKIVFVSLVKYCWGRNQRRSRSVSHVDQIAFSLVISNATTSLLPNKNSYIEL